MRDPINMKSIVYNNDEVTILQINEIPEYDLKDWDLEDEKDFKKYMKTIENNIRHSYEYREMINFLRNNMDMNKCSFYENVNNIETYKIKIHIHHDPITLYDICLVIYNKRKYYGESLSEEMIAKEVMFVHYSLLVGLIPLAETVHELVHNQYLFVPTDRVMGKYRDFVNMYYEFFLPEQLDILERIENYSLEWNDNYKYILNKNYVYIDLTGSYAFPKYEDVIGLLKNRVEEVKENKTLRPLIHKIKHED
jgi:hypothetical protein